MKTNKSFSKRLRVTKNGKVLARQAGQNHFNAKESRSKQLGGKKLVSITINRKTLARMLSGK